jgi:MoxR-like ATPase
MKLRDAFAELQGRLQHKIIGQSHLQERLLIALLADGHLLVEGAPGLAKTRAIKSLGELLEGDFHRIQFTPDLLPADVTGTEVFRPQEGSFLFQPGPVFHNLVLADEINRAPAKVQSALLEAMAERQVTIGRETYALPELFLVMATQNPIEQEGTYPLPEAQLDRFLLHVEVGFPSLEEERQILSLSREEASRETRSGGAPEGLESGALTQRQLFDARQEVLGVHLAEPLERYLVELVGATREPLRYGEDLADWIELGASPRATIALDRCSRARAWLKGRDFVSPDDVQELAPDVLRHRILLSYEAEAGGISAQSVVLHLLRRVPLP